MTYQQPSEVYSVKNPLQGKTSLWMGELDPWMDENFIKNLWYSLGEQVNVKMIRDKFTRSTAGYCFVEFSTNSAANKALTTLTGTPIPGTNRIFKLNWASGGGMGDRKEEKSNELSVFVGDIGPEVNDELLLVTFQSRYISIQSARVVMDPLTGMSKGYGFVRFGDENEQQRAMVEMQGAYCGSRPIRISVAVPKTKLNATNLNNFQHTPNYTNQRQFNDPSNTNVFVGGLPPTTNDDELRSCFQRFGDIVLVKIPPGRGCGFVQFVHRHSAELAISQMNGSSIGNSRVRVSWGRPQTDRQPTNSFRSSLPTPVPSTPMDPLAPIHIETTNSSFINSKEDSIESFTREISSTDNIRVL